MFHFFRSYRFFSRSNRALQSVIASLALILIAPSGLAADALPPSDPQALANQIAPAVQTLQAAQRELAITPLDEDGVLDRVGRDPAKLSDWVRTQIAYEPYRGFLKGAQGALISGRANSGDKSLLLADLLTKAGFKVQLVEGETAAGAQSLVANLRLPAQDADQKTVDAMAARTGIPAAQLVQIQQAALAARNDFQERLWNRTFSDIQTVSNLLDQVHVPVPPLTLATESPSNHWWVRTPSGDLDPTIDKPPANAGQAFDMAQLPPAEFHQAAIKMMIRKDNNPAVAVQATYRSADVFGRTVTVANLPMEISGKLAGIGQPSVSSVIEVLTATTKFQPQIMLCGINSDSAKIVSGKGFDLSGKQFDVGHGQTDSAGQLGGGLGGLLGGGGRQQPASKLTGAWIEINLTAPGQAAPTIIRRDLFTDSADLSQRQKVLDLLATREILLLPEEMSDDYVTSLTLDSTLVWAQYLSNHPRKDLAGTDPKKLKERPHFTAPLYAFGVARRASLAKLCEGRFGVQSFAHVRPTAVSYVTRFIDGHSPFASISIDILDNTLAPATASAKAADPGWRGNFCFACGMLDTALEHELLRDGTSHHNASVSLQSAMLSGNGPIVASGKLPGDLLLSPSAAASINSDLSQSACVVMAGAPAAWYRIRLDTGMSLGFIEGGGGQEASEYAEMAEVLNQMIEMIQFYGNLGRCLGQAIGGPLAGQNDWHENLEKCFTGACAMVTAYVQEFAEVDVSWTNLIICKTTSYLWDDICDKLWENLGGGEGGGGEGAGGGE